MRAWLRCCIRSIEPEDAEKLSEAFRAIGWSKPAATIDRYAAESEAGARWEIPWSGGAIDMASKRRGLPHNSSIVIPRLFCRDPAKQIDFCVGAFDAIELGRRQGPDGEVVHALLTVASEMIMIESEWPTLPSRAPAPDGSSPVVIFLYVEDVDDVVGRATALGATVILPAEDQFWGDRIAWIKDPSGHVWTLATRVEGTTGEERDERWSHVVSEQRSAET